MTIDDLRAFIYLYQLRSFTKAARQFHLSQPELSKRIRRMEDELNIQLVDTSNRRHLKITPAGELVYHHASQIMAQFQGMMSELDKLCSSSLATFRVGTVPVAGQYGIASRIGEINHHFPQTEVQLLENEGDQILHQLKQGTIDAAILRDTQTQGLSEIDYRCFPLTEDELVVVMDKHNPLARKKTVSIQDLKDVPIASLPVGSGVYEPIVKLFEQAGLTAHIIFQSTHIETLREVLKTRHAVSLLFRRSALPFMTSQMVIKRLDPPFTSELQVVYPKNRGSYQLERLLDYLKQ